MTRKTAVASRRGSRTATVAVATTTPAAADAVIVVTISACMRCYRWLDRSPGLCEDTEQGRAIRIASISMTVVPVTSVVIPMGI